jgi:hypothetical protein
MIYTVSEANAKIIFKINQVQINRVYDIIAACVKGFGFGMATIIIIMLYKNIFVKILFALFDGVIIYFFIDKDIQGWIYWSSHTYPVYVVFILIFMGLMVRKLLYRKPLSEKDELQKYRIKEEISNLKRSGRGKNWQDDPDKIEAVKILEKELQKLEN